MILGVQEFLQSVMFLYHRLLAASFIAVVTALPPQFPVIQVKHTECPKIYRKSVLHVL